jgi:hypothetical protein
MRKNFEAMLRVVGSAYLVRLADAFFLPFEALDGFRIKVLVAANIGRGSTTKKSS